MKPHTFDRFQCWDPDRVGVVINKEAISVDRATFLATHAPLDRIHYQRVPHKLTSEGEEGLLEELVERSRGGHHSFVVVQGIPGTGKSHLIRWLKEQYWGQMGSHDVVLLIERAQCTLRGSIEQIIQSGVFDDQHMRDQLNRLKTATVRLSSDALAENILSQLHVVAIDAGSAGVPEGPGKRILALLPSFLLDRTIRTYLKRTGGPVERIRRYLAQGPDSGVSEREEPRFLASDFDLPDWVLNELHKQGYREALDLAKDLQNYAKRRDELATYLNHVLNQAIGRMTALSADDLKSMFADLRRQLRAQGRGLALFIEDITAFTGIDSGLVDVLATQHTGEANTEFCRLLSVIGVTDSYYHDRFPTNIKDRITHHLTLNASTIGSGEEHAESELLRDPAAIADLSARYLNAMRLSQEQLEDWSLEGARPKHLPNACRDCPFRAPCHTAFGAVALERGGTFDFVGLYPFNYRALVTMYTRLKNTARTPRSLLQSVIAYVLQSHGPDVAAGTFPPPAADLSADVRPPVLEYPGQQQTILSQAGSPDEADRIETLLLYWGNRTAYTGANATQRTLGDVPEGIFTAFSVRFIPGEPREPTEGAPPESSLGHGPGRTPGLDAPSISEKEIYPPPPLDERPAPPQKSRAQTLLAEDIDRWRRGSALQHYKDFARQLVGLFRKAIDWEDYGITAQQVDERLQEQRFVFEGQTAGTRTSDYLTFSRSPEMAAVLHTLLFFGEATPSQDQTATAGHLARLSAFMHRRKREVVDFVLRQRTTAEGGKRLPLSDVLVLDAVLQEVLIGGLSPEHDSPEALLQAVITRWVEPMKWSDVVATAQGVRPPQWVELLKRIAPKAPGDDIRRQLLALLNRPQGSIFDGQSAVTEKGRPVYFLDVAPVLRTLRTLVAHNWELPPLVAAGPVRLAMPSEAERVYAELRQHIASSLDEQRQQVGELAAALVTAVGDGPPTQALDAVIAVVRSLQAHQHAYDRLFDSIPDAADVEAAISQTRRIGAEMARGTLMLSLSAAVPLVQKARKYRHYFDQLARFLTQKAAQLDQQRNQIVVHSQLAQLADEVENAYAYVISAVEADLIHDTTPRVVAGPDDGWGERRTG